MSGKSRAEITSAEDKSIGFDYQYYFFLNELLNLKAGQTVGLEVLDDVHIERADGTYLLVQLKHTIQTNTQGLPVNLTSLDVDLWKSLSNWCKIIIDPAKSRVDVSAQTAFIQKTSFLLVSNKSESSANSFLSSLAEFKAGSKTHSQFIQKILDNKLSTEDKKIQEYITDILSLDQSVSNEFFKKLSFALGYDEIINKCKMAIYEKQINESNVDDVFRAVDSDIRSSIYNIVKSREKVLMNLDEFNRKCRRHFDKARNGELFQRDFSPILPEKLTEQTFIKQLVDIEDITEDSNFIEKFTIRCLQFRNNIERWYQDGEITQSDVDKMEKQAELLWESHFLGNYPSGRPTSDQSASGRLILKELRQKELRLASTELPIELSHGGFYDLSDRPVIGWLCNWEDRYK